MTCGFLYMCSGYYSYREGSHARPSRAGSGSVGRIVHPQEWPEDLDYVDKKCCGDRVRAPRP